MRKRTGKPPVKAPATAEEKAGHHPRSRHRARYDFPRLLAACPELGPFVARNPYGDLSVDFADPAAVKALNRALLQDLYGVRGWDIPPAYLCPPVPGRADHVHHAADLLASERGGRVPTGPALRVLDVGTGANCIYPLIGHREYGWRFLGSDVDKGALDSARRILAANPGLAEAVELRLQRDPGRVFEGLLKEGESFDLTLCNPPFHASAAEARAGSERKWRNLGRDEGSRSPVLNFGGRGAELWCPGGEAGFLGRMVEESARIPRRVLWFSTLVSKSATLPALQAALRRAGAAEVRVLDMAQGQKKSRLLAWTFQGPEARKAWAARWDAPLSPP